MAAGDLAVRALEALQCRCGRGAANLRAMLLDYITSMKPVTSSITTTSDRLTTVLSYGVLLLLIYLVFRIYEPFLPALGWAAILAIFFYPMHNWMARRFSPNKAAILSALAVTILLIVPAILVTTLFIREAFSVSKGVQHTL